MTVIAYRDGIMAADSLTTIDDVNIVATRKVERRHGYLVGMRGEDCPSMAEAMDWVLTKRRGQLDICRGYLKPFRFWDDRPQDDIQFTFALLVVNPKRCIFAVDQYGTVEPIPSDHYAIGSGSKYALGVMGHSKKISALDGVRAGIRGSAHCRAPIYWWGLDGREGEVRE